MGLVLRIEPDPGLWIGVPDTWPSGDWGSPEEWSTDLAKILSGGSEQHEVSDAGGSAEGGEDAPAPGGALQGALMVLACSRLDYPADRTYAYLGGLPASLCTLDVAVFPAEGEAGERHRDLGRADAPGSVGAVQVDDYTTEALGRGSRVLRFDRGEEMDGDAELLASLRYFWRVGEEDVAVNVSAPGPLHLVEMIPAVEALLESIEVVSA